MSSYNTLVKVDNLKKYFPIKSGVTRRTTGYVKAVDDISFDIKKGETFGLVGESGCGKSTTGRTILRLIEATEGKIEFDGKNIQNLKKKELRKLRTEMQIIFQDPYSSLNPRLTVAEIVGESLSEHKIAKGSEVTERVVDMLEKCGLSRYHLRRYPHEFSGGQRQRIGIARALILEPKFVVCDEAVSALDVSIQSQVINLLKDLQDEMNLTYFFISHDLSVVKYISDRIGVMYLGQLVEVTDDKELFINPVHPYTKALLSAIPTSNPRNKAKRVILKGDIPSPANPPLGCRFHTRCKYAMDRCKIEMPLLKDIGNNHFVACHLMD